MSLESGELIKCPRCGKGSEFIAWKSLNSALNPEAKADLVSGKLFVFKCPHCGAGCNVDYGMLYHQMDDKIMIHYALNDEEETEVIESFEKMSSGEMARSVGISLVEEGYTFRVVRSQNQLREKIVIFDNKLDDRVIEVMKLFLISHLSESNSELEIENLFLEANESGPEHFAIQLKDGNWGSTAYIPDLYESIRNDIFKDSDDGKSEYIVNCQWALDKINSLNK